MVGVVLGFGQAAIMARKEIWQSVRKRRYIKYYPGEGFKINEGLKEEIAQGVKDLSENNVKDGGNKIDMMLFLTMKLDEFNKVHAKFIREYENNDKVHNELSAAIFESMALTQESQLSKLVEIAKNAVSSDDDYQKLSSN